MTLRAPLEPLQDQWDKIPAEERTALIQTGGDDAQYLEFTLRGIISTIYNCDERELRRGAIELSERRACVKQIDLLVYWPVPLLSSLHHDLLVQLTHTEEVQLTYMLRSHDLVGQYWFGLLRSLDLVRARVLAGFPVRLEQEERGEDTGNRRGDFRYIVTDYTPPPPLHGTPHRAKAAFMQFYELVLLSVKQKMMHDLLAPAYTRCFRVEFIHKVFHDMHFQIRYANFEETITTASVVDVLEHLKFLFLCDKPIGYVTGLGGAGKSYSVAIALILFVTWANSTVLQSRPFRALVTGPRIASLQTWTEQVIFAVPPTPSPEGVDLLQEENCSFVRILPTRKEEVSPVEKQRVDLEGSVRKRNFKPAMIKNKKGPWVVLASTGTAKALWTDLQIYESWMEELDMFLGEEGQQLGHADSIALQCVLPWSAMVVYVGDPRQPGHIGDSRKRGARQCNAALEASLATLDRSQNSSSISLDISMVTDA